ncbi:MAG: Smr/MutS family protein [Alphaproteobacteria bacterium]|nr:Smr/MutS family protein [Alphaproteobacteria bacterium]
MKRRLTSAEERAEFEAALKDHPPRKVPKPAPPPRKPRAAGAGGGLDGNTRDRLKRGLLEPEARLDLHGMSEEVAHRRLAAFLAQAQRNGARLTLIVTGKSGVLKSLVPRWLGEPVFANSIADQRSAHVRHGGAGALYVYLRKKH